MPTDVISLLQQRNSLANGYVGTIVDTPQANTRVAFDNITVYSLD